MESAKKSYSYATYIHIILTGKFLLKSIAKFFFFFSAFTMEQDIPDYDMDSDDEKWINSQAGKLDITPLQVRNIKIKYVNK